MAKRKPLNDLPVTDTNTVAKRQSQTRGLRKGNPGNRGGGDNPKTYKLWLKSLLDSEKHRQEFTQAIQDRDHPTFMAATRHAAEFGHGKPAQRIEVEDTTPREALTLESALAKVSEMARAAKALGLRAPLALPPIPEGQVEDIPE